MEAKYVNAKDRQAKIPQDQRILVDEVFKVLYYNNKDPERVIYPFDFSLMLPFGPNTFQCQLLL